MKVGMHVEHVHKTSLLISKRSVKAQD